MEAVSVLGLELSSAIDRLEQAANRVTAQEEVRSRKGLEGDEKRVVRQKFVQTGCVELTYALFRTRLIEEE